jgi:hypothetical protein
MFIRRLLSIEVDAVWAAEVVAFGAEALVVQ